ncbi:hypothetical protein TNCT_268731 [Trichonephila clavata]|uniref:Uncharacterized protein n=1 Tax=Trichonephila clavata TaxID=2740835 RepID=A0A8X6L541_TRICU|nr:hypothetical protein TNCT_268731 [Trichonephila clavata]
MSFEHCGQGRQQSYQHVQFYDFICSVSLQRCSNPAVCSRLDSILVPIEVIGVVTHFERYRALQIYVNGEEIGIVSIRSGVAPRPWLKISQ